MNTSEQVLKLLESHRETSLSGEEIAEKLNISRTSVWKAVNKLQKQGYSIKAVRNKGYSLIGSADFLLKKSIEKNLTKEVLNFIQKDTQEHTTKLKVFSKIDSTNTEAKKRITESSNVSELEGTIIIAEQQTSGRGRLGRSFYSPAHNGIYMSIIFSPKNTVIDTTVMTAAAAVAVCRVLEKYGLAPQIKWVNDIFLNNKKICGILTEGTINLETGVINSIILGIGLNVYSTSAFSADLQKIAGAVFNQKNNEDIIEKKKLDRNVITADILNEVCAIFLHPKSIQKVMQEYSDKSMVKGKKVTVLSGNADYEATVLDITPEAHLIIKTKDGKKRELLSGEVSIKPINY